MARLVRCPKCTKLLVENSEATVYKCGGCNTVLRARNHKSAAEFDVTGSPQASIASRSSDRGYSDTESPSLTETTDSSSVPASSTEEFTEGSSQPNQPDVISDNGFSDKEIPLPSSSAPSVQEEHGEDDKEQHSESSVKAEERMSLNNELSFSRISRKIDVQSQQVEVLHSENAKMEDVHVGKTREQANEAARLQSTSLNAAFQEDSVSREQNDGAKSPATISSQIYDGSISSSDDGRRARSHPLSRRTFKNRTPSRTLPKEDVLGNDKMSSPSYMDGQDQARAQLSNPGNDSHYNDVIRSFNAIKDEIISKYESGELFRRKSFDSEEFMSVDSWMEEKIGSFKTLPKGLNGSFHEQMELLRKVDELKAQIISLYIDGGDNKEKHIPSTQFDRQKYHSLNPSYRYEYPRLPFSGSTHCSCLRCIENQQSRLPVHDFHSQSPKPRASSKSNIILDKSPSKERPKLHCRPVSGAAPFVICYHCMKLLQLPADFIISRRKLHKLQCGACKEILMLSFPGESRRISEASRALDGKQGYSSRSMNYIPDSKSKAPPRLHWLMGYDSATELLYKREDFDEGFESGNSPAGHSYRLSARSNSDIRILGRSGLHK